MRASLSFDVWTATRTIVPQERCCPRNSPYPSPSLPSTEPRRAPVRLSLFNPTNDDKTIPNTVSTRTRTRTRTVRSLLFRHGRRRTRETSVPRLRRDLLPPRTLRTTLLRSVKMHIPTKSHRTTRTKRSLRTRRLQRTPRHGPRCR